ncbi:MAG: magnesium transporter [Chloroflexi bacterium]|nr:MAG: magnesium transporter [Chloroflexota bacterium]
MPKPVPVPEEHELRVNKITWGGLTWVNIESPTTRETEYLAENYHFHPLDLDDCLSRRQRPKIDEYEDYLFIVLHFPLFSKEMRVTVPSQVSVFIGSDYLVTVHQGVLKPLVKLFKDCQLHEETRQTYMKSSGYLLYRIVDRLIDYCLPITDKIMENLERVEHDIFDTRGRGTVIELSVLRRDIISYRRVIWPMRAVVATLGQKTQHFTPEDMEVFWGDLVDHVDKIWDVLDECKEIVEGLKDTNDSLYSHRTNEVIRILTVISTVVLPLTLVASIYGMNVPLPGGVDEGNLTSFVVILALMLVVIGAMVAFFRQRRWL